MPTLNESSRWAFRILLCLATAVTVSATAFLCAYFEHRGNGRFFHFDQPVSDPPTLWEFTTADTEGILLTCLMAGVFAFPLFLLPVCFFK